MPSSTQEYCEYHSRRIELCCVEPLTEVTEPTEVKELTLTSGELMSADQSGGKPTSYATRRDAQSLQNPVADTSSTEAVCMILAGLAEYRVASSESLQALP